MERYLNKSMILHALRLSDTFKAAAEMLGTNAVTLWRNCKHFGIDSKAILKPNVTVETVPQAPVIRNKKPNEPRSVASSYSGPHLGDYSR